MTIEGILEEKNTFDLNVRFERVGGLDEDRGWSLPGINLQFFLCDSLLAIGCAMHLTKDWGFSNSLGSSVQLLGLFYLVVLLCGATLRDVSMPYADDRSSGVPHRWHDSPNVLESTTCFGRVFPAGSVSRGSPVPRSLHSRPSTTSTEG